MDSFPLSHQGSPVFSLTTLQTTKEQGPWLSYLLRWLDRAKHACTNRFPLLQIMVMSKLRLESKSSTIQPSCPQYLIVKPHYVQSVTHIGNPQHQHTWHKKAIGHFQKWNSPLKYKNLSLTGFSEEIYIYSFIQQIISEHLLGTSYCARHLPHAVGVLGLYMMLFSSFYFLNIL